MLMMTIDGMEEDCEVIGLVQGSATKNKGYFDSILWEVRHLVDSDYGAGFLENLREKALKNMEENALQLGASAVMGVRYVVHNTDSFMQVLAYGTAVMATRINKKFSSYEDSYRENYAGIDLKARLRSLNERNKGL